MPLETQPYNLDPSPWFMNRRYFIIYLVVIAITNLINVVLSVSNDAILYTVSAVFALIITGVFGLMVRFASWLSVHEYIPGFYFIVSFLTTSEENTARSENWSEIRDELKAQNIVSLTSRPNRKGPNPTLDRLEITVNAFVIILQIALTIFGFGYLL